MANKGWKNYYEKAIKFKLASEMYLNQSLHALMLSKGFSSEQLQLFDITYSSSYETVISFNHDCEMADLDIELAAKLSKEEIIETLSQYARCDTVKQLNGE